MTIKQEKFSLLNGKTTVQLLNHRLVGQLSKSKLLFCNMGCSASRGVNPIDAALLQALIDAKQKRGHHELTFNELLLKFPKVRPGSRRGGRTMRVLLLTAAACGIWVFVGVLRGSEMPSCTGG